MTNPAQDFTAGNVELLAELSAAAKAGTPGLETHPDYVRPLPRYIITRARPGEAPSLSLSKRGATEADALAAFARDYGLSLVNVYTIRPAGTDRRDANRVSSSALRAAIYAANRAS